VADGIPGLEHGIPNARWTISSERNSAFPTWSARSPAVNREKSQKICAYKKPVNLKLFPLPA